MEPILATAVTVNDAERDRRILGHRINQLEMFNERFYPRFCNIERHSGVWDGEAAARDNTNTALQALNDRVRDAEVGLAGTIEVFNELADTTDARGLTLRTLDDRINVLEARAPVLEAALGKRIEQLEKAVADLAGPKPAAPSKRSAYDLPPMGGGIVKRRSKRIPRRNARALLQGNY
eukprot:COSAG05_NODE_4228_length_1613_cov_13.535007_2_plen_178_part_00